MALDEKLINVTKPDPRVDAVGPAQEAREETPEVDEHGEPDVRRVLHDEEQEETNPDDGVVVEEAEAAEEGEKTPEEKPEEKKAKDARPPSQDRITELAGMTREQAREIGRLEAELKAAKGEEVTPEVVEVKKPVYDDFETPEDYLVAMTEFVTDQKIAKAAAVRIDQDVKAGETRRRSEAESLFRERQDALAATVPDYHDFATVNDFAVTQAMADAILQSERGPEILYALGKDHAEAERISALPWQSQFREIGKLEAMLEGEAPAPKEANGEAAAPTKTQAKRLSSAPAPTKPVGGGQAVARDENRMSTKEFYEGGGRVKLLKELNKRS